MKVIESPHPQHDLMLLANNQNVYGLGFEKARFVFEKQLILAALERNDYNQAAAAADLKMSRQLLNFHIVSKKIKIKNQRNFNFLPRAQNRPVRSAHNVERQMALSSRMDDLQKQLNRMKG